MDGDGDEFNVVGIEALIVGAPEVIGGEACREANCDQENVREPLVGVKADDRDKEAKEAEEAAEGDPNEPSGAGDSADEVTGVDCRGKCGCCWD